MKMVLIILFLVALLSYTSNASSFTNDFCVANLGLSKTPSGYPCKLENIATENDFAFSGFVAQNIISPFNVGYKSATVNNLPGLNGLGISAIRVDFGINGTVPMHIHPDATELTIVVEGVIIVGFITPTNVYVKILKAGDVFVFPKGLVHLNFFLISNGINTKYKRYSNQITKRNSYYISKQDSGRMFQI